MRKKFIAGNWKMFKTAAEAKAFAEEFSKLFTPSDSKKVAVAAPFTQLFALSEALKGSGVLTAAQNMHFEDQGAFTGEISADMLLEAGAELCIIGHSERRQYFAETNDTVNKKVKKALEKGLDPIVCVGESLEQRESGQLFSFVETQLREGLAGISPADALKLTVAYEPIWAIGTGRTASSQQAQEMCAFIRKCLADLFGTDTADAMIIQYGGSVKPSNARELLTQPDIDGALVGGASLKPEDFIQIINY